MKPFTVLHTSDWHLGHQLHHRRRDEEFLEFLTWLKNIIREQHADALVVAGDIFDSSIPGPGTQKMYYDFLLGAANAGVRHIIVTAGNHDSPALISAAGPLLARLHIHVIGSISGQGENEIKVLTDENGRPELIVCAVPHIRERDARISRPGESIEEKERAFIEGIRNYYQSMAELAAARRKGLDIPILATGHLFITSATPTDEERNLYIGNLGQIPADIFSPEFDYIALGHIHRAQKIEGRTAMRYSGSPLPMSFDEARYGKEVTIIRFNGRTPEITSLIVPRFRKMLTITGNKESILNEIRQLRQNMEQEDRPVWLEIRHSGQEDPVDLQKQINEAVDSAGLQVLCIKTDFRSPGLPSQNWSESLENISPEDIFKMRIQGENLAHEEKEELMFSFQELLKEYYEAQGGEED